MLFNSPAGPNPIDRERVVGKPHVRIDGPLKTTGRAKYAYEYHAEAPNAAYGFMLGSAIGRGVIEAIDTTAAEVAPGVLLVLTYKNMPRQGRTDNIAYQYESSSPQLRGPEINFFEQSVAFVVAETFEEARAAARLVKVTYRDTEGRFVLAAAKDGAGPATHTTDTVVGDFEGAFASAPVKVDVVYTTPDQSNSPMEPHASMAVWDGDQLTLYTAHQVVHWAAEGIADTLQIPQSNVRVVSAYVGGGFGSKLMFYGDAVLAAAAALKLGRPVKAALTRPQMYNHTIHRPATIQRVRLGADHDGRLVAVGHDAWSGNQPGGDSENAADQTKLLYAGANRLIRQRLAMLDLPPGGSMRAPGEAAGLLALECAMDELAEALQIDPIELRIRNDTAFDPSTGPSRPFSSRHLVEALRTGAERFGWSKRNPAPGQVRDGQWLVGIGVAAAIRGNELKDCDASARLDRDAAREPRLTVETQMTDIGTGSYTILAQIAAEMLGLPIEQVTVRLGDGRYPLSAFGSGGSWGANSAGSGVFYACEELRAAIARKLGFDPADTSFEDGRVSSGGRSVTLQEAAGADGIAATGGVKAGDLDKRYAQASFGAHFAEVGVDSATAEVRIRRMLSVAAAGRIINPVTARSQCLGGMTMGIGAALMEEQVIDPRYGFFVNHDFAEYQVPVHADIPDLDVHFLAELDEKSSPIKGKGVGELGICGVGAAVANAVYNACGVRVRDYPLTMDKILDQLPA
jgi:xanthine dehydrogenase YagR molybdenum-binding subunit